MNCYFSISYFFPNPNKWRKGGIYRRKLGFGFFFCFLGEISDKNKPILIANSKEDTPFSDISPHSEEEMDTYGWDRLPCPWMRHGAILRLKGWKHMFLSAATVDSDNGKGRRRQRIFSYHTLLIPCICRELLLLSRWCSSPMRCIQSSLESFIRCCVSVLNVTAVKVRKDVQGSSLNMDFGRVLGVGCCIWKRKRQFLHITNKKFIFV